jgi:hypothetical protein
MVNKLCICWSEKLWYYRDARCYNKNHLPVKLKQNCFPDVTFVIHCLSRSISHPNTMLWPDVRVTPISAVRVWQQQFSWCCWPEIHLFTHFKCTVSFLDKVLHAYLKFPVLSAPACTLRTHDLMRSVAYHDFFYRPSATSILVSHSCVFSPI